MLGFEPRQGGRLICQEVRGTLVNGARDQMTAESPQQNFPLRRGVEALLRVLADRLQHQSRPVGEAE